MSDRSMMRVGSGVFIKFRCKMVQLEDIEVVKGTLWQRFTCTSFLFHSKLECRTFSPHSGGRNLKFSSDADKSELNI